MIISIMPISDRMMSKVQDGTSKDPTLKQLSTMVRNGWPERSTNVPKEVTPYFAFHDVFVKI